MSAGHALRAGLLALVVAGCAEAPRFPTLRLQPIEPGGAREATPAPLARAAGGDRSDAAVATPAPSREPWRASPPPPAAPRVAPAPPAARELTLSSGLRVVAVEHHDRAVVIVTLLWPHGSLSDPPEALGATSLAVQIATDYRERWDNGDGEELVDEKSLRQQVSERGGVLSSGTGHDTSWLSLAGYAADTGAYLEVMAGAVRQPRHGPASFKARRDSRLDFLEDLRSSDGEALERVMAELAFGQGHSYGRSVIGTYASLQRFGLEDVERHQAATLVPEGATLLVVGDVDANRVLGQARAAFGAWQGRALPQPTVGSGALPAGRRPLGLLRRQPASTLVTCATRPLGDVRASPAALELLAALLGQGAASRLSAALRDGGGHTYSVSAIVAKRRQGRAFMACAALGADRADTGLKAFRDALEAVRSGPPSEADLARARGVVQARLDESWDDAPRIASAWLEAITLGEDRPRPERRRAELAAVTAAELGRAAREILAPDTIRWVVSGEAQVARRAAQANGQGAPVALTPER